VYPAAGYARATLVLAHGAGAGQRSAFIVAFGRGLSARGVEVVTFDFPYITAKRRVPDRGPALEASYREVVEIVRREHEPASRALFIGGKSMGGRIATQVAAADPRLPIVGLIVLGYPLHPPGRPTELRTAHLPSLRHPLLVVQGSRDAFGTPEELRAALGELQPKPLVHVVESGDHSLKVSRASAAAQSATLAAVQDAIASWIGSIVPGDGR
jgi:predicted alpha/beta-hydrolase family hydrolase